METYLIPSLDGGLNLQFHDDYLKPNQLKKSENIRWVEEYGITSRPGTSSFICLNKKVKGVYCFETSEEKVILICIPDEKKILAIKKFYGKFLAIVKESTTSSTIFTTYIHCNAIPFVVIKNDKKDIIYQNWAKAYLSYYCPIHKTIEAEIHLHSKIHAEQYFTISLYKNETIDVNNLYGDGFIMHDVVSKKVEVDRIDESFINKLVDIYSASRQKWITVNNKITDVNINLKFIILEKDVCCRETDNIYESINFSETVIYSDLKPSDKDFHFFKFDDRCFIINPDNITLQYYKKEIRPVGLSPPTQLAQLTELDSGILQQGTYSYCYTFLRDDYIESNPSLISSITLSANNKKIKVECSYISPLPSYIKQVKIYRTHRNEGIFYYVTTIPLQNNNTYWTTEDNIPDNYLGEELTYDRNIPPKSSCITATNNYVFLVDAEHPNMIRYSKIGTKEYFPATNYILSFNSEPITAIEIFFEQLVIFTASSISVVSADISSHQLTNIADGAISPYIIKTQNKEGQWGILYLSSTYSLKFFTGVTTQQFLLLDNLKTDELSYPIDVFFKERKEELKNSYSFFLNNIYYLFLSSCCVIYDIIGNRWSIFNNYSYRYLINYNNLIIGYDLINKNLDRLFLNESFTPRLPFFQVAQLETPRIKCNYFFEKKIFRKIIIEYKLPPVAELINNILTYKFSLFYKCDDKAWKEKETIIQDYYSKLLGSNFILGKDILGEQPVKRKSIYILNEEGYNIAIRLQFNLPFKFFMIKLEYHLLKERN
jgi:hypothetical protein